MSDYIQWIRQRVGSDLIQLNYAAACILNGEGQVLLQRRGDDGLWGFPGGAVELGETVHGAVVREVAEETGLRVRVDALQGIYSGYQHVYPNGDRAHTITAFLLCSITGSVSETYDEETLELRFCALDADMPGPLSNRQHEDALADLRAGWIGVLR